MKTDIKKQDARILWNINPENEYKISEIVVAKCNKDNDYGRPWTKKFTYAFGNCDAVWKDYSAADVMAYILLDWEFESKKLREFFFDELSRIVEFKKEMKCWIESAPINEEE